jgi:hypothetical protein
MSQTPPLPPPVPVPPGAPRGDLIPPSQAKDPVLACALGLLWLGYFLYGQWQKGIAAIGLWLMLFIVSILTCGAGFVLYPAVTVAIMIDTYLQAENLKNGHAIGQWTFFKQHA